MNRDLARTSRTFDVLDVLTRAGDARERLADALGEQLDAIDALLVSDVLRTAARVGDTLDLRRALVQLCALLRALDAAERELITLDELRAGLALHAARSDRFEHFADARVVLRTLAELLERDTPATGETALRGQVALLHAELRAFAYEQLTGSPHGELAAGAGEARTTQQIDPRADTLVTSPDAARANHELVDELLHGARHHPVTGLLGAAWVRGWSAVPLAGEQLGEDDDHELDRLADALLVLDNGAPRELVQVDLRRQPRLHLDGRTLTLGDGLRRSWTLPASRDGLALAACERPGWCVLATDDLAFAIVEGAGHHALLGPTPFVTAACGMSPLEAVARFREHVESMAGEDEDPPADLLEVAERFGRLRRRSR